MTEDTGLISSPKENYERCCICQDDINNGEHIFSMDCGHDLHLECIFGMLSTETAKRRCPLCLIDLNKSQIKDVFTFSKMKIPEFVAHFENVRSSKTLDDLMTELLICDDIVVQHNTIFFNLFSNEWLHLFKRIYTFQIHSNKYFYNTYAMAKRMTFKVGSYSVGFYMHNVRYKLLDDDPDIVRVSIKPSSRASNNLKELEKLIKHNKEGSYSIMIRKKKFNRIHMDTRRFSTFRLDEKSTEEMGSQYDDFTFNMDEVPDFAQESGRCKVYFEIHTECTVEDYQDVNSPFHIPEDDEDIEANNIICTINECIVPAKPLTLKKSKKVFNKAKAKKAIKKKAKYKSSWKHY